MQKKLGGKWEMTETVISIQVSLTRKMKMKLKLSLPETALSTFRQIALKNRLGLTKEI